MAHPIARRALHGVVVASLALGMAAPAFARDHDDHDNRCDRGHNCAPRNSDNRHSDNRKDDHRKKTYYNSEDRREDRQAHDARKFYRLSAHERAHLPPLPRGQSYRRDGDRVVRVNDNTGAIIAALGMFAIIANMK